MINVEIWSLNIGIVNFLFWDFENVKIVRVFKCATNLFRGTSRIFPSKYALEKNTWGYSVYSGMEYTFRACYCKCDIALIKEFYAQEVIVSTMSVKNFLTDLHFYLVCLARKMHTVSGLCWLFLVSEVRTYKVNILAILFENNKTNSGVDFSYSSS
jgi:hypothetical protein